MFNIYISYIEALNYILILDVEIYKEKYNTCI